jgi:hypothetical protein
MGGNMRPGELNMVENWENRSRTNSGRVAPGMTPENVERAWGKPDAINRRIHSGSVREQWVYRRGQSRNQYVYIEDGKVTTATDFGDE